LAFSGSRSFQLIRLAAERPLRAARRQRRIIFFASLVHTPARAAAFLASGAVGIVAAFTCRNAFVAVAFFIGAAVVILIALYAFGVGRADNVVAVVGRRTLLEQDPTGCGPQVLALIRIGSHGFSRFALGQANECGCPTARPLGIGIIITRFVDAVAPVAFLVVRALPVVAAVARALATVVVALFVCSAVGILITLDAVGVCPSRHVVAVLAAAATLDLLPAIYWTVVMALVGIRALGFSRLTFGFACPAALVTSSREIVAVLVFAPASVALLVRCAIRVGVAFADALALVVVALFVGTTV